MNTNFNNFGSRKSAPNQYLENKIAVNNFLDANWLSIAKDLYPNAVATGQNQLRIGSIEGEPGQSMVISRAGFHDFANDQHKGNWAELVARRLNLGSWKDGADWLAERAGGRSIAISHSAKATNKVDPSKTDKLKKAAQIWKSTVSLNGTLGWQYFKTHRRNDPEVWGPQALDVVRFHPSVQMRDKRLPAVVFRVDDARTGRFGGIHRIALNSDGSKHEYGKMRLGSTDSPVIRFCTHINNILAIGEGPETTLRLLAEGCTPIWSTIDAGGMKRFPLLDDVTTLHIFGDKGKAGEDAAMTVGQRYADSDRWARAKIAKLDDFDADILAEAA